MPRTLYAKLALGLALLLGVVGLSYALISLAITGRYFQTVNQQVSRDLASNLVRDRSLVDADAIDENAIAQLFHDYMEINPSIEIYLLDASGAIRTHAAEPGHVKRKAVALGPVHEFLAADASFPIFGDDPRDYTARKLFSVAPLPSRERPQGYLYVILSGEQFDAIEQAFRAGHVLSLGALALAASLAVGLAVGLIVFRLLTRRLRALRDAVRRQRDAGPGTAVLMAPEGPSATADELDELTASFADMSTTIRRQFGALQENDRRRRELLANVSHDLRTPLTALHGYLQTLRLKDHSLAQGERLDFIETALRNSDRLERLVADLFELARLDARELAPEMDALCLAKLTGSVVADLGTEAHSRGVALDLQTGPGPMQVRADAALIERVLINILGNALEHTPPGGRVRVTLCREHDTVVTRIADSGAGIAAPELPRVFDRHYRVADPVPQGSASRSPGTKPAATHAGLGLAISKRILDLHGAEISIDSVVGRGTTLEYSLPAA